ncbi:MAG TPA: UxaA family hydrolase [Candidatus Dormibacteraeota bacterium]|nr:UxaA family hydrolase [Candidatus Dormibacteraeota bacterium]
MSPAGAESRDEVQAGPAAPHFLVHNEGDHVAVAVQDVKPGTARITYLDSQRTAEVAVREDVPLGHKVALVDLPAGVEVIEYGVVIGRTRQAIGKGQWVHVHNLRSARWEKSA